MRYGCIWVACILATITHATASEIACESHCKSYHFHDPAKGARIRVPRVKQKWFVGNKNSSNHNCASDEVWDKDGQDSCRMACICPRGQAKSDGRCEERSDASELLEEIWGRCH